MYPCPACGAPADLDTGCRACGRAPDPQAAEVVRLNAELAALAPKVEEARRAFAALAARFGETQRRRDDLAVRVRQAVFATRGPIVGQPPFAPGQPGPAAPPSPPATPGQPVVPGPRGPGGPGAPAGPGPEARSATVQNLLFVLGGLLVGAAAIVFAGVAWATYGAVGRSLGLGAVTLLALAVPPLAVWRGLRGTAETFAALAMLLVVLDGYAAWYVNLFGLGDVPGPAYAAGVCAVTGAIGVAYGLATGLAAPRFAALVAVQPVVPLLAGELGAGVRGWSVAFTVSAVASLAAVRLTTGGLRVTAWALYGCAQGLAAVVALAALLTPGRVDWPALAGGPALLAAGTLVAAGLVAGSRPLRTVAAAVATVAVGSAVVRPLAQTTPSLLLVLAAVTVLALVVGAHLVRSRPQPEALGVWIGGIAAVALLTPFTLVMAAANAVGSFAASLPVWRGGSGTGAPFDWQVPVAVALATAALALALPARARWAVGVAGGAVALLGLPAPWWTQVPLELAVVAALALVVSRFVPVAAGIAAAVLATHAVAVSLVDPWAATAALGALVLTGAAAHAGGAEGVVRRVTFAVGLTAWPAAAACAVFAAGAPQPWPARTGLAAAAPLLVPVALLAGRATRGYALAALAAATTVATLWPDLADSGDPTGLYPALGLVVLAVAYRLARPAGRLPLGIATLPHGLALLVVVVPLAYVLFLAPYAWLGDTWSGTPDGVGHDPGADLGVPGGSAAAVLLVAVAFAVVGQRVATTLAGLVGVVALLAAAEAPWPTVPAASLALGTALTLVYALRGARPLAVVAGILAAAAGLAGLLPTEASTLAGLGLVVVAGATVGAAARHAGARTAGWLVAAGAGGWLGVASTLAAGLPLGRAAYPVLGVAALALALSALLRLRPGTAAAEGVVLGAGAAEGGAPAAGVARGAPFPGAAAAPVAEGARGSGRRGERVALDAAAHATAVVALLLTITDARHAAAVCTLWAAALAVRAVAPRETARRTLALVAGASVVLAWWLLLAEERVAVPEAYTLPAALLALVAGHLALRARPGIGSWVGYGSGLAVALLPSLASILAADGQGTRRLLLGAGALAVVLVGARQRRQAPLIVGGVTLVVVAIHEILVWDVLPRWAYLAVGGLLLIGVAMTYERRLRDLRRLRGALARMT
ncbi:SCO7613 C-terminal domain-containing membrane protein [Phytohabitans kaempferiae]|uniref:SCO7613 C-terminal domain-containing membrane protein n=1 Tax=Phytohabitans kaempferiae TaxID=1620943 RepID=A0ABV6MDN6_9ACTN